MRHKILLLITAALIGTLSGYQPITAQSAPIEGKIIFGAWWDSNHDGAVVTDTDIRSLFQLSSDPSGAVRITPITQREAALPLVRPDGSAPFYLDRGNLLQTPARTISREPVLDSAYTPDGGRLAILTQPLGLPNRNVSIVDVRTGVLTQFTGANIDDTSLSLSPDGSRILFTQSIFGVNRLYGLDLRTGAVIPITDGSYRVSSPRWSPNGSALAYVRTVDNNRNGYDATDPRTLWLTDPNGINQRQISPAGAVDAGAPIWSPDGIHIAFAHRNDNDANGRISPADALQLAVADVATGVVNAVAAGIAFQTVLWNPSGTRLAFRGTTTDTNGDGFLSDADSPTLWVMRSTDVVAAPLTSRNQVVGGAIAWSPDGTRLAYTIANHDDNADGRITEQDTTQLYVALLEAALARPDKPLVDGPRIGATAWSPSGVALALVVQSGGSLGTLVRADVSNGALAPLTDKSLIVDSAVGLRWVR